MYNKWGKFFEFTYGGIQVEILKVSSRSVPNSVAGAVSGVSVTAVQLRYRQWAQAQPIRQSRL